MSKTIKNTFLAAMAMAVLCGGTVSARQLRTQANLIPVCRGACSTQRRLHLRNPHWNHRRVREGPRASQKAGKVVWKRMPRRPLFFCSKGERSWVGKSKQHSLLPLLLPSYAPGPSQPGNCRSSQESSAFVTDVAAPPNHARAHAPACI